MSDPRCDQCGKQPATIRYTEIDDGKVTRRKLCQACAVGRGLLEEPSKPVVLLQEMLSLAAAPATESADTPATEPVCSACGISFRGFQRSGRLGCTTCYTTFRARLVPLLRKLHGSVRHAGKSPRAFAHKSELRQRVEDLRAELERAVRGEDYERAARLRDELRAVEHEQSLAARRPAPGGGEPGGGS